MSNMKRKTMPDTGEEDIVKVHKADVVPKLTCMRCSEFFRGPVTYCKNEHGLCSICLEDKKKCPIRGCDQKAILTLAFPAELVKDMKFPVSCKFRKDGCDQKNADEEVITDHEIECGLRKVPCFWDACPDQPAMDFDTHLFSAHDGFYGKFRDYPGKWFIEEFAGIKKLGAQKMWIDPETDLRFTAGLYHHDEGKHWRCYTMVFAGKNVAKKFRAKMRLSSYDRHTSLNFNCGVKCLDDWRWGDASKEFRIDDDQFKICNKGHIGLGAHNKDKNGEVTLPVTVEVKIKKLKMG